MSRVDRDGRSMVVLGPEGSVPSEQQAADATARPATTQGPAGVLAGRGVRGQGLPADRFRTAGGRRTLQVLMQLDDQGTGQALEEQLVQRLSTRPEPNFTRQNLQVAIDHLLQEETLGGGFEDAAYYSGISKDVLQLALGARGELRIRPEVLASWLPEAGRDAREPTPQRDSPAGGARRKTSLLPKGLRNQLDRVTARGQRREAKDLTTQELQQRLGSPELSGREQRAAERELRRRGTQDTAERRPPAAPVEARVATNAPVDPAQVNPVSADPMPGGGGLSSIPHGGDEDPPRLAGAAVESAPQAGPATQRNAELEALGAQWQEIGGQWEEIRERYLDVAQRESHLTQQREAMEERSAAIEMDLSRRSEALERRLSEVPVQGPGAAQRPAELTLLRELSRRPRLPSMPRFERARTQVQDLGLDDVAAGASIDRRLLGALVDERGELRVQEDVVEALLPPQTPPQTPPESPRASRPPSSDGGVPDHGTDGLAAGAAPTHEILPATTPTEGPANEAVLRSRSETVAPRRAGQMRDHVVIDIPADFAPTTPSAAEPSANARPQADAPARDLATPRGLSLLERVLGTQRHNPITLTATVPGYQVVNRVLAGGDPGSVPKHPALAPLSEDDLRFQIPEDHAARMHTARSCLDQALGYRAWLTPSASTAGADAGSSSWVPTPSRAVQVTATALQQPARFLGLAKPEPVRLEDMRSATPVADRRLDLHLRSQRALIRAEGARYAARAIAAQCAHGLECLMASAREQPSAVFAHVQAVGQALSQLHGESGDATPLQRDEARAKLAELEQNPPLLELEMAGLLAEQIGLMVEASVAKGEAEAELQALGEASAQLQGENIEALLAGIDEPLLKDGLTGVATVLKALRADSGDRLPADGALEKIHLAGIAAFDGDAGRAGEALAVLRRLDLGELAAAVVQPDGASEEQGLAVRLAQEIGILPRGIEMLTAVIAPSQAQSHASVADSARATTQQLRNAARVLFIAHDAMHAPSVSAEDRQHLDRARQGAATILTSGIGPSGLEQPVRAAFNAVRNGLVELGKGSPSEKANAFLTELTGSMLTSRSRANGLVGAIARSLPIGGATALNRSAVESASRTLAQAQLIEDTDSAMQALQAKLQGLRHGDDATPAERALHALGSSLEGRTGEALVSGGARDASTPERFGLDEATLEQHPALRDLWMQLASGEIKTHEAAHRLAHQAEDGLNATDQKAARDAVIAFRQALDKAVASALWNRGEIQDKHQLLEGLVAVTRLLSLRDRFKFTGGNAYGFDTSKLQLSVPLSNPALAVTARAGLAAKYQHDLVVEIGLSVQAFYLTVGTQSTFSGKASAGVGLSVKQTGNLLDLGGRVADATIGATRETQWQEGLLARIPRDKKTEATNRREFEDLLRHAILWQDEGHASPVEAVLGHVDTASLNLLGQYDRRSTRGELALGIGLQVSASVPSSSDERTATQIGQLRLGPQARVQGETRHTRAEERTGHLRYQETKISRRRLVQSNLVGNLNATLGGVGGNRAAKVNASEVAAASRSADWVNGAEITRRLVTMDGDTDAFYSRRVTEYLDLPRFRKAAEHDRARWVNRGLIFTQFPAAFTHPVEATEHDFEAFFRNAEVHDNQFKQYNTVDSLQHAAAAIVDDYEASIQQARRMGHHERADQIAARLEQFVLDESSWQPRRLVINNAFNTANQPGVSAVGVDLRVSDNSEGVHNESMFPRD